MAGLQHLGTVEEAAHELNSFLVVSSCCSCKYPCLFVISAAESVVVCPSWQQQSTTVLHDACGSRKAPLCYTCTMRVAAAKHHCAIRCVWQLILTAQLLALTAHLLSLTSHLLVLTSHLLVLTSHLLVLTAHLLALTAHLPVLTTHLLVLTTHLLALTAHLLVPTAHCHYLI